ncbi:MAG: discoidin domain-containing protein [Bacteroidales bacterium]|nr:discoidin domain-containing protein [Bacteroidales bacterium]
MRKLFLFVVAFLFIATSANAEKLAGTLSSNLSHYTFDGNWELSNAADGDYTTKFWSNTDQAADDHITMTLSSVASVGEIKLFFADGDKPAAAAIEVSADNSDWQSVATFTEGDIASDNTYTCDALGASAQYVRLRFTQTQSSRWFQLFEFEVYEAPVTDLTPRTITVSVADATMGTAYIGTEGTTSVTDQTGAVQITAVPAAGYKFEKWTVGTEDVATTETYIDKTEGSKDYVANFVAKAIYEVSVSVNDALMGAVTATQTGDVYEGDEVTFTATPSEGYELVNWTVGDEEVSDELSFTTTINATAEYKANFRRVPTKASISGVTASFSPSTWYPISNVTDGSYTSYTYYYGAPEGTTVTVTLAEETNIGDVKLYLYNGYSYYHPAKAKVQFSTDGETWNDVEGCSFTSADIVSDPVSGKGLVTLDANAVSAKYVRYYVEQFQGNYFYLYEFEVYEALVEVEPRAITVAVNDETMGTAYIVSEGITSVADQTGAVNITAVPKDGYEFVNWTLNGEVVSTKATFVDQTAGDKDYVANFIALVKYNVSLSVNDPLMGTATASETGEMFKYTEVTFTATPTDGYEFVNWTIDGEEVSRENPYVASIEATAEYVANFRLAPVKLALIGAESSMAHYSTATADKMIDGIYDTYFDTSNRQTNYEEVTVTVTLAEESFVGDVKINFIAGYRPNAGKIQVSTDGETWTDVEGSEFTYDDVEECGSTSYGTIYRTTVDAKGAMAKYVRMYVTEKGNSYLTICEFEVYEAPVNVAARTISVSVNDDTMGTAYIAIEGITEVTNQTAAVKMVAVPNGIGYKFINWTLNGEEVATSTSFVDRTEGDKAYVANFIVKPQFAVSATSIDENKGTVEATQTGDVYEGESVTFSATAADGYKFVAWKSGDEVVSELSVYTVTVTEAISLVATFERDPELNRSAWTVYDVSSEYSGLDGGQYVTGDKAIDGKLTTYWHTDWDNAANKTMPQWIVFDLGAVKSFDAFNYVSRSESQSANGNINGYKIYVSDEAPSKDALISEMTEVHSGTFTYPGQEHKVTLANATKGRYVMLYVTSSYGDGGTNMFANCAEFYLYSSSYAVTVSSSNPELGTAYIGEEGVTSVGCSVEGTDVVTLTAVPATGYRFVNWTLDGVEVSTDAVYTTTAVTEARSYVANFEFDPVEPRTVKVASNDKTKGYAVFVSPMPEGTATDVTTGDIVTVEAIAQSSDDFFVNWTINGVEVGTEPTFEYLGAEAATIQANFISKYVVTIDQVEGGTISVKSGETYVASGDRVLEGNYIKMTVTENNRSELKKLFVNGEDVFIQYKYNPDYCVQVNGPMTITAEYGDPICYFTYECTGNGWIEAWESDTYDEVAEEEGTLELPVSPAGEQYAYGDAIPFLGTAAIFVCPGEGAELISITVNGEELEVSEESDIIYYGDYFIDPVEGPIHVVAEFTGPTTGVEDAEISESSIYAVAGGVQVEVTEATTVEVYTIAGTLVSEQVVSEQTTIALQNGVYIVKAANEVVKVVVK